MTSSSTTSVASTVQQSENPKKRRPDATDRRVNQPQRADAAERTRTYHRNRTSTTNALADQVEGYGCSPRFASTVEAVAESAGSSHGTMKMTIDVLQCEEKSALGTTQAPPSEAETRKGPYTAPKSGTVHGPFREHAVVEVAGIEPASSDDEPGLLRAQLARRSLGSCARTSTSQTSPVSVNVPVDPSDDYQQVSPLDEARIRDGGTPGLTVRSLLRQRERTKCA